MRRKEYHNSVSLSKVVGDMKINVKVRIDDQCGNGHCDFAITADIYEKNEYDHWVWSAGGCCHDAILKHFPELSDFVALHLSNAHGQPMYAEGNGCYILKTKGAAACANYLRIDVETACRLSVEKDYFKYQLFALGIVDKWQQEADAAIRHFEKLKGELWVNPYSPEEERGVLKLTDEERVMVEALIREGYYTPEALKDREEKAAEEKRQKDRAAIIERCDKKIAELIRDRDLDLCLFDNFGTCDNVIYYSGSNEVCFNWKNYGGDKIWTQEEFDRFVEIVDRSIFPEGVKFEIKSK